MKLNSNLQKLALSVLIVVLVTPLMTLATCYAGNENASFAKIKKACVGIQIDPQQKCIVAKTNRFAEHKNSALYWAKYSVVWTKQDQDGEEALAIFNQTIGSKQIKHVWTGKASRVLTKLGWLDQKVIGTPSIVTNANNQTILMVPVYYSGTGHFNDHKYFQFVKNTWHKIETSAWLDSVQKRLPKGHGIWKGVTIDVKEMRVSTPVWQKGDGNCCPSGGRLNIALELVDKQFRVKDFQRVTENSDK